ncbi:MAG TPA: HNH endonuclease [Bryobacteraceae bacterium]|nr:HNH endonuclease [Bryobacteraceae bacterium]
MTTRTRKSLWDADHIMPVVEGGGECDLANLRTLCLKCHGAATAALRRRRGGRTNALLKKHLTGHR